MFDFTFEYWSPVVSIEILNFVEVALNYEIMIWFMCTYVIKWSSTCHFTHQSVDISLIFILVFTIQKR